MPAGLVGIWSDHQYLIASLAPLRQFALYWVYLDPRRSVFPPLHSPRQVGRCMG